jgi:hypothetical protein
MKNGCPCPWPAKAPRIELYHIAPKAMPKINRRIRKIKIAGLENHIHPKPGRVFEIYPRE